jgi:hypothetical protein
MIIGAPAADNNQKEDAPHLYISSSLHRRSPRSGRFAAFIAGVGDDFFLVDVICNWRLRSN